MTFAEGASPVRCVRCAMPVVEAVLVDDGYLCVHCSTCCRCGRATDTTYLVGVRDRACAGCLTLAEQLDRGLEDDVTLPPESPVLGDSDSDERWPE